MPFCRDFVSDTRELLPDSRDADAPRVDHPPPGAPTATGFRVELPPVLQLAGRKIPSRGYRPPSHREDRVSKAQSSGLGVDVTDAPKSEQAWALTGNPVPGSGLRPQRGSDHGRPALRTFAREGSSVERQPLWQVELRRAFPGIPRLGFHPVAANGRATPRSHAQHPRSTPLANTTRTAASPRRNRGRRASPHGGRVSDGKRIASRISPATIRARRDGVSASATTLNRDDL
jgi:hypothetical protein